MQYWHPVYHCPSLEDSQLLLVTSSKGKDQVFFSYPIPTLFCTSLLCWWAHLLDVKLPVRKGAVSESILQEFGLIDPFLTPHQSSVSYLLRENICFQCSFPSSRTCSSEYLPHLPSSQSCIMFGIREISSFYCLWMFLTCIRLWFLQFLCFSEVGEKRISCVESVGEKKKRKELPENRKYFEMWP